MFQTFSCVQRHKKSQSHQNPRQYTELLCSGNTPRSRSERAFRSALVSSASAVAGGGMAAVLVVDIVGCWWWSRMQIWTMCKRIINEPMTKLCHWENGQWRHVGGDGGGTLINFSLVISWSRLPWSVPGLVFMLLNIFVMLIKCWSNSRIKSPRISSSFAGARPFASMSNACIFAEGRRWSI